jgi:hypothetical protein
VSDLATRRAEVVRALGGTDPDPTLRVLPWQVAGDTVALRYELTGLGALTEQVRFPDQDLVAAAGDPAVGGALTLLQLAALTSYAKAVVPARVELGAVPPAAVAMVEALLTDGLAEFAVVNDLHPLPVPHLDVEVAAPRPVGARPDGVLVPIGGGKDSAVSAALVQRCGLDAAAFAVDPRPPMLATADAVGLPLVTAHRTLDPTLLRWNDAGAWNGHVPITAIVASVACVAATLTGRGEVLLSNEASADAPTRTVDGREVNHQFSKSSAFEALHVAAATELTGGAVVATSLLRPLPELLIAAAFARSGVPLGAITSCNRAFARSVDAPGWCGSCAKCRFVQLQLAPFVAPEAFAAAAGFDALADVAQVEAFGDLLDPARKPFECVGTVEEVQLAFDLAASDPAWAGHPAVARFGDPTSGARERFAALRDGVDTSMLSPRSRAAVDRLLQELTT